MSRPVNIKSLVVYLGDCKLFVLFVVCIFVSLLQFFLSSPLFLGCQWSFALISVSLGFFCGGFLMASEVPMPNSALEDDILELSINDPQTTTFNENTLIGLLLSNKVVNFKVIKGFFSVCGILALQSKSPTWNAINLR